MVHLVWNLCFHLIQGSNPGSTAAFSVRVSAEQSTRLTANNAQLWAALDKLTANLVPGRTTTVTMCHDAKLGMGPP